MAGFVKVIIYASCSTRLTIVIITHSKMMAAGGLASFMTVLGRVMTGGVPHTFLGWTRSLAWINFNPYMDK